ncbi:triose-phosphate isomerase [Actinoallomurus sp. NPDC052308]|uniref:triose-phosphate isomerase n=1 Tax=Actinoallomurus sp. NPDC052308 TaxID=3155530 RepID=UPI00343D3AA0
MASKSAPQQRKPLIAGNWKMNLTHFEGIAHVQKVAFGLKDADYEAVDVAMLPPFTFIRSIQMLVDADKLKLVYGAQDVSPHEKGAYTGEISAAMLAKLGCTYVLAGHSERRQYHHEDDTLVNAKVKAALKEDLTPILCVGEGLEIRKAGEHLSHTLAQVEGGLQKVPADQAQRIVIAYEPVWAIGTGEVATPEDAQEVCGAIRTRLAELYSGDLADQVRVLYGGSVKGGNIAGIMAKPDIDGALVGGASLDAGEFVKICRYRELPV